MEEVPEKELLRRTEGGLDYLLRKYLRVWIWSIIFGLDTTLTLTLSTHSISGKYAFEISLVLVVPTLAAALAVIMSWLYLGRYLSRGLMPLLRPTPSGRDDDLAQTTEELRYLTLAMQFAIFSVVLRALGFLIEALFGSLDRF
jgi:hypothetical protein